MLVSPPLHALQCLNEPSPICLTAPARCSKDAEVGFGTFGWSDLPCLMESTVESTMCISGPKATSPSLPLRPSSTISTPIESAPARPSTPPPPPPVDEDEQDIATIVTPSSPKSSAQYDLDASSEPQAKKATRKTFRPSRKVTFSQALEVRTYEVILGDHPCCRGGMALQIGWSHNGTELVDLEVHEEHSRHRRMDQLRIGFYRRRNRLQKLTGLTGAELLQLEYMVCCEQQQDQEPALCLKPPTVLHRTPTMKIAAAASS